MGKVKSYMPEYPVGCDAADGFAECCIAEEMEAAESKSEARQAESFEDTMAEDMIFCEIAFALSTLREHADEHPSILRNTILLKMGEQGEELCKLLKV